MINLKYLVQAWELYLLLIPRFRPSHCLSSRISNAEAHAVLYIIYHVTGWIHDTYLYKTRRHLPLPYLLLEFKVAKFEAKKTRRQVNAFQNICIALIPLRIGVNTKTIANIMYF